MKWLLAQLVEDPEFATFPGKQIWVEVGKPESVVRRCVVGGGEVNTPAYRINSETESYMTASVLELLPIFADEVAKIPNFNVWAKMTNKEILALGKVVQ